MFPILQPVPVSQRKQDDSIRTRRAPAPARVQENDDVRATDINARLRRVAKKVFWMMGED
jgi:hypothetical protein